MMRTLTLSILTLWAATASAQEMPCGGGDPLEVPELGSRPRRIVVVVTQTCRAGVCVRLTEYREVEESAEQQDSEYGFPVTRRRTPRVQRPILIPNPDAVQLPPNVELPTDEPDPAPAPTPQPTCGNREETEAWRLLNAHRAGLGQSALGCDLAALKVARAHSQDMCTRSYFSHHSPEGSAPWDRMRRGGMRFAASGENIAMGYTTARATHQGWLDSPGHRANIERAGWTRAAVGMISCDDGTKYWTQLFAR